MKKTNRNKYTGLDHITDFLFETGILANTPRSWPAFLGSGRQSVAEHINRVCYIGYCLAQMEIADKKTVDVGLVVQMCLFHDVTESRISDLNYVHQKYTERLEEKAQNELVNSLPFGKSVGVLLDVYHERKSIESLLAKDADNLEFILSLKEQIDVGNTRAKTWMKPAVARLKTVPAQKLANLILKTDSDRWWFDNKEDEWWVSRGQSPDGHKAEAKNALRTGTGIPKKTKK